MEEYSFHERLIVVMQAITPRVERELMYPIIRRGNLPFMEGEILPRGARFEVYTHTSDQVTRMHDIGMMKKSAANSAKRRLMAQYPPDTYEIYLILPSLANA